MGDHRLHLRRKMKENNGKLKKLEASLIKIPQSISSFSKLHSKRRREPSREINQT